MTSPDGLRLRASYSTPKQKGNREDGTETPGRKAMNDPLNTPLRKEMVEKEREQRRASYSSALFFWCVLTIVTSVECFVGDCFFARLVAHTFLPQSFLYWSEVFVVTVCAFHTLLYVYWLVGESPLLNPVTRTLTKLHDKVSNVVSSSPAPAALPPPHKETHTSPHREAIGTPSACTPLHGSSSPSRTSPLWLQGHSFGDMANTSTLSGYGTPKSPLASSPSLFGNISLNSSQTPLDISGATRAPFTAKIAPLPATKMLNSIHTKEQLNNLLSKREAAEDTSLLSHSSSFYQAMLSLDGLEAKPYQMSAEAVEASQGDAFTLIKSEDGSMHLSPKSTHSSSSGSTATDFRVELNAQRANAAGGGNVDGGRRRKTSHHTSPVRSTSAAGDRDLSDICGDALRGCGALSEGEMTRAEQRMRVWIVNTIIRPIHDGINGMNKQLETSFASLQLRIGVSPVENIRNALTANPQLSDTILPYILPYLSIHTNQAYLVSRIAALSCGSCMADFSWASGGPAPLEGSSSSSSSSSMAAQLLGRLVGRGWNDTLPTDTFLVLSLFATYMDKRVTANPMLNGHNVEQPFSARYTLIAPAKPTVIHNTIGAFYIHLSALNPPSLSFVTATAEGVSSVSSRSLFRALVLLLAHAKYYNNGMIDRCSLSNPSLNLGYVLGE